jgi:hypothetical protein
MKNPKPNIIFLCTFTFGEKNDFKKQISSRFGNVEYACAPLVPTLITNATYGPLNTKLKANVAPLKTALDAVKDQASYAKLLAAANTAKAGIVNGRILVTLPDGTVIVDTSKTNNTYQNYKDKKINENHNSRIAILDAQLYECGQGVETKFSSTDNVTETYVALRLGNYLNNSGTARLSKK